MSFTASIEICDISLVFVSAMIFESCTLLLTAMIERPVIGKNNPHYRFILDIVFYLKV